MESIVESGMTFIVDQPENFFYVEKSSLYHRLGGGVKIVEFAFIRDLSVFLVEAKSSSPRPGSGPNFDQFIFEIVQKMSNTLQLLLAAILKRHNDFNELSNKFMLLPLQDVDFKCVLIINGHAMDWLPPLQEALSKELGSLVKTMALKSGSVAVINDVTARKKGFIL